MSRKLRLVARLISVPNAPALSPSTGPDDHHRLPLPPRPGSKVTSSDSGAATRERHRGTAFEIDAEGEPAGAVDAGDITATIAPLTPNHNRRRPTTSNAPVPVYRREKGSYGAPAFRRGSLWCCRHALVRRHSTSVASVSSTADVRLRRRGRSSLRRHRSPVPSGAYGPAFA